MATTPTGRSGEHALPAAAVCRRVWDRHASSRPLPRRLSVADTDVPFEAWVLDVSVGGLGLVSSESLPLGTLLQIELETHTRAAPLKTLAKIVYCQPTPEGEYRYGCQFVTPLTKEQLRDLLQ